MKSFNHERRENKKEERKEVLLLIDWDNLFLSLYERFRQNMQLEDRLQGLMSWIKSEIGEILDGYGFVFAPEHLNAIHEGLCTKNDLRFIICPKREVSGRSGKTLEDTVDGTLMWFARLMMRHPDIGFICLVSGDDDYVPMLKEAHRHGIKVALIPPTFDSLSKRKGLLRQVDEHPVTGKRMILVLESVLIHGRV